MRRRPSGLAPLAIALPLLAMPAAGLVIDGSDPSLSLRAPPQDPGWRNVGHRDGRSAVYLGGGWVLTAAHVGVGPVVFDGGSHAPVPGSAQTLHAPGQPGVKTDLLVFRVAPEPALPTLVLRRKPVRTGALLLLVGYGSGRGDEVSWQGGRGFAWRGGPVVRRWGTNHVLDAKLALPGPGETLTRCFRTSFNRGGSLQEAQGTLGDSGGAVFMKGPRHWKLAGLILAVELRRRQPFEISLYGNRTTAADLSYYEPQLSRLIHPEEGPERAADPPPEAATTPRDT
jgi:hypothetical protein